MARVHVTARALRDLDRIESFSVVRWGGAVAARYLDDLDTALRRIEEYPDVLRPHPEFSERLLFQSVREHLLVCDRIGDHIYLLGVWHCSMDVAGRLDHVEPHLRDEVEILHERLLEERGER